MTIRLWRVRLYPLSIIIVSLVSSIVSPVRAAEEPYAQTFVVTAYYSPLPGQQAYARGSYEDDIAFNGEGHHGADGTPVEPGMIAAPPSYAFGTVIDLHGIGVGTVHDRGGRIIEWGDDLHRIDIWMGAGDEGLARAMTWGVRTIKGTVYPPGTSGALQQSIDLDQFPSDINMLASLPEADPIERLSGLGIGMRGSRVRYLQSILRDAGIFDHAITGEYGDVTKASISTLLSAKKNTITGDSIDERTAAMLYLWPSIQEKNLPDVPENISIGMSGTDVRQIQKLLRFLGMYRGRTDGRFTESLKDAVIAFQVESSIVDATDPSAGRVGPATARALKHAWKVTMIASMADRLLLKRSIADTVVAESLPMTVLTKGARGTDVRRLQKLLVDAGFLASTDVTGTFGARTSAALLRYQMERSIVTDTAAHGAGVYGPATRSSFRHDLVERTWRTVKERGVTAVS